MPMPTSPLDASVIEPTDFDNFLAELGLDILPQEEQDAIADQAREMTSFYVTEIIRERLDEQQQQQLANMMDNAKQKNSHLEVNEFLLRAVPDLDSVIEDAVFRTKQTMRKALVHLPDVLNDVRKEMEQQQLYFSEKTLAEMDEAVSEAPNQQEVDQLEARVRSIVQKVLQETNTANPTPSAFTPPLPSEPQQPNSPEDGNGIQDELNAINN